MTWPVRYSAQQRTALRVQRHNDIRNIPPLWFWRFDVDDSPESPKMETEYVDRVFFDPIGVHLFIRPTEEKGPTKTLTDEDYDVEVNISLAEMLRIGVHFAPLSEIAAESEEGYALLAGDIFQFDGQLFQINERAKPRDDAFLGPTRFSLVYRTTANSVHQDTTEWQAPVEARTDEPVLDDWPKEMRADAVNQDNP